MLSSCMADTTTQTPGASATTGSTALTAGASDASPPTGTADPAGTTAAPPTAAAADAKTTDTEPAKAEAPGEKTADTKAKADAPLELKLPEGVQAGEAFEKFKGLAKEYGLKGEQAQKVVDLFVETQRQAQQEQDTKYEQLKASWRDELKTDKDIGGVKLDASVQAARKVILKFGDAALREGLERTGYGDWPPLVRLMAKLGKAMGEDSVAGANGGAPSPGADPDAHLRKMYPTMFKES